MFSLIPHPPPSPHSFVPFSASPARTALRVFTASALRPAQLRACLAIPIASPSTSATATGADPSSADAVPGATTAARPLAVGAPVGLSGPLVPGARSYKDGRPGAAPAGQSGGEDTAGVNTQGQRLSKWQGKSGMGLPGMENSAILRDDFVTVILVLFV